MRAVLRRSWRHQSTSYPLLLVLICGPPWGAGVLELFFDGMCSSRFETLILLLKKLKFSSLEVLLAFERDRFHHVDLPFYFFFLVPHSFIFSPFPFFIIFSSYLLFLLSLCLFSDWGWGDRDPKSPPGYAPERWVSYERELGHHRNTHIVQNLTCDFFVFWYFLFQKKC